MRVAVIMGGPSAERDISLHTGTEMLKYLNTEKYQVTTIILHDPAELDDQLEGVDFALLALHGEFGEDGTIQKILEDKGIPYSGSGPHASALCMNKALTKNLLKENGLPTPPWLLLDLSKLDANNPEQIAGLSLEAINKVASFVQKCGGDLVVKPNSSGSSLGITILRNLDLSWTNGERKASSLPTSLLEALILAKRYDHEVMLEAYIEGDEITCSLLKDRFLPPLLIRHEAHFFNYYTKYVAETTLKEEISDEDPDYTELEELTRKAYQLLGCNIYGRLDFIRGKEGLTIIEMNTLPGMTSHSLFPYSASLAGLNYTALLDELIS